MERRETKVDHAVSEKDKGLRGSFLHILQVVVPDNFFANFENCGPGGLFGSGDPGGPGGPSGPGGPGGLGGPGGPGDPVGPFG